MKQLIRRRAAKARRPRRQHHVDPAVTAELTIIADARRSTPI